MNTSNEELFTQFRAYLLTERCVAHNTYLSYSQDISQLILFLQQENVKLLSLSVDVIKKFLQKLHAQHNGARSIARKIATLKLLFRYLHMKYGIADLGKELRTPQQPARLPYVLSIEEIEKLLIAAAQFPLRDRLIIFLLYATGMRVSELVSLTVDAIDYYRQTLCITGKGNKQRIIPLSPELMQLLQNYIKTDRAQLTENSTSPYLFIVKRKNALSHLSRQACWLLVKRMWALVDSEKSIWPHQLRHSLATHLLAKGVNLRLLQLLLGHEQLSTVQIYTHVDTSFLRTVYNKKHPRS